MRYPSPAHPAVNSVVIVALDNLPHNRNYAANPVGLSGLEPLTPALSAQCSNRLSYRPMFPCRNLHLLCQSPHWTCGTLTAKEW